MRAISINFEVIASALVTVPVCGAVCAVGSPLDGVHCNLPPEHSGEHEAVNERHDAEGRPRGVFDLLEAWS